MRKLYGFALAVSTAAVMITIGTTAQAQEADSQIARERQHNPGIVAIVGGVNITRAELDAAVAARLAQLEEQVYRVRWEQLQRVISERLLSVEAQRRGLPVDALITQEITGKVKPVTDADVEKYIEDNRQRMPPDFDRVRPQVRTFLEKQRESEARDLFLAPLRQKANVEIFFVAPAPYRAKVSVDGSPSLGLADAPVTIVEFADFSCPYCRLVQSSLRQLLAKYPTTVRLVFKHFPLETVHPDARRLAEASWCAAAQDRFWQFEDAVFAKQRVAANESTLSEFAQRAGLDLKLFHACLSSGEVKVAVQTQMDEAARLGISGTPSFLINGRFVYGALPVEAFVKIVEEEVAGNKSDGTF
jgi:protein-disulfide isomerase